MEENRQAIIELLKNKAAVKQDIADYSESVMALFKKAAAHELEVLHEKIGDPRVRLRMDEKGVHEFILYVGSDVLVFQLHRNIFRLPDENPMWKTTYLEQDEMNGYFGIINIYNFLAESFEQNRFNDPGYLIGRVFMNRNSHFMVEGRGQLGFLFRDLENSELKEEDVRHIIQTAIIFAIEFDLLTPPYDLVQEVSVMEIQAISSELQTATGKRMGFKFSAEGSDFH
ncbi:MAG: hypothetical protein EP333_05725 [Bacteroidetes bacterium]|nr:MAG: hypothetical protein EP333_05725 [Bacteroidota bacterium]